MNEVERRASQASAILKDPLFEAAYKAVEAQVIAKMYAVDPLNERAHTRCIDALKALRMVKGALESHIATGQVHAAMEETLEPKRGVIASLRRLRD